MSKWLFSSVLISLFFLLLGLFLQESKRKFSSSESSFECGMEPLSEKRKGVMMHFFWIAILFVIFDLEFAVIIPLLSYPLLSESEGLVWVFVVTILSLGLILENFTGTLNWKE